MTDTKNILFVCTGNTCRSVMAEYLFHKMAREGGLDVETRSAGVSAVKGIPPPEEALKALRDRGVDGSAHASQPLTAELVDWADLVLTMEERQQMMIAEKYPRLVGRLHTLKSHVGLGDKRRDIRDPIGCDQKTYDACAAEIEEALKKLIEKLSGGKNAGAQESGS